jgi:hypothetical protein
MANIDVDLFVESQEDAARELRGIADSLDKGNTSGKGWDYTGPEADEEIEDEEDDMDDDS